MTKSKSRSFKSRWRWLDARVWRGLRRFYLAFAGIILLLGFVFAVWAVWIEPDQLKVTKATIALPDWPTELDSFKVVALSDLHVGAPHITLDKLREVVERANAQEPDLTVLLGDYVIQGVIGGRFIEPELFADTLKELKAKHGVYAVLGNHDWWLGGERVTNALQQVGIRVLTNEVVQIQPNGKSFWLVGMGDYFTYHSDIEKSYKQITAPAPIIVITHTPDIFLELPKETTLTLAGHTHGGQVNLPLLGRRVVPSNYGEKYASGYVEEEGKRLFVTTGIGTSILPARFRVPPEIAVLTLRRGD